MQTAAKPADAADLDTGREHGPEPPPAVMEPLEKRIGGLTAKVSARPDGTHYDFGEFGTATVHPRNGAAGRPQAGLGYDPETARAVLARRMYGNINHLNQDGSQVAISPVARQRATNNPGYTFVGGNADAQRFFQPVPHGGGYNPYKVRFRTLFDEQLDARFAKRQEEPRPQMDMSLPGHSRRLKYSEDMRAWEAQRARNQGYDSKMAELALKQEEMAQKAEALRQAGIGAGLQWQGQAMDNAAKEQALNRTARIQRLQARWIQSNDPTERAELAQQIQMLGDGARERERTNSNVQTFENEDGTKYAGQVVYDDNGNPSIRRVPSEEEYQRRQRMNALAETIIAQDPDKGPGQVEQIRARLGSISDPNEWAREYAKWEKAVRKN